MTDYYAVLGLPTNATSKQVRDRFLDLARERHPDRFQGQEKAEAEIEFQRITEAFNILSDPERRRQVDLEMSRPTASQQHDPGHAGKVYMQRGIKAYKEKNYLQAAENFTRVTKEDPDNARGWHYLALACQHQRRWHGRARSAIAKACELEPMNANYLKMAGRLFAESGMASRAERYYEQALNWGGDDPKITTALEELRRAGKKGLFGRGG
jgi:curved DNA-binding protein CbpA